MALWNSVDDYLDVVEAAHRKRCGERHFCYVAVTYNGDLRLWRMAVTADDLDGYITLSDDLFLGDEREMRREADRLNDVRLNLTRRESARIIGASMARKPDRAA